jgi:hypothetical protein
MSDQKQKGPSSPDAAAEHAPDIQQPGPAGDFGGGQPMPKPAPGDPHEAARRPKGKADAAHPEEAAEPSNPYAGT